MTVAENEARIAHIEKILDLLHPVWRHEDLDAIEAFVPREVTE